MTWSLGNCPSLLRHNLFPGSRTKPCQCGFCFPARACRWAAAWESRVPLALLCPLLSSTAELCPGWSQRSLGLGGPVLSPTLKCSVTRTTSRCLWTVLILMPHRRSQVPSLSEDHEPVCVRLPSGHRMSCLTPMFTPSWKCEPQACLPVCLSLSLFSPPPLLFLWLWSVLVETRCCPCKPR